ncbi:MAG TPA: hypothetical protein HA326_03225 [Thermoplasmata archaeon]|nr:hypothetical protein [Thermoplasmata archaeon]
MTFLLVLQEFARRGYVTAAFPDGVETRIRTIGNLVTAREHSAVLAVDLEAVDAALRRGDLPDWLMRELLGFRHMSLKIFDDK